MICTTTRKGDDCVFMTTKGCSFEGGTCLSIDEKCEGCAKTKDFEEGKFCSSFPAPLEQWRLGNCSMATHVQAEKGGAKKKINPIKASKRR